MLTALDKPQLFAPEVVSVSAAPRSAVTVKLGVADLWRESLQVMAQHSAAILCFAFLGFAVPAFVSTMIASVIGWQQLSAPGAISQNAFATMFWMQWAIQAGMAILLVPIARGVISWLALHHNASNLAATGMGALRATMLRWPALLFSFVIYGTLICAGAYAMMLLLRDLRVDTSSQGVAFTRGAPDATTFLRTLGIRSLQGLVPNPGSPFSDLLEYIRFSLRQPNATSSRYVAALIASGSNPPPTLQHWLIGGGALLAMFLAESLFRLRISAIMSQKRPNLVSGIVDSAQLGWRWFGHVTLHITILRLIQFFILALFFVLPLSAGQTFLLPRLSVALQSPATITVGNLIMTALATPVTMLFAAFLVVYDSRLYVHLHQARISSSQSIS